MVGSDAANMRSSSARIPVRMVDIFLFDFIDYVFLIAVIYSFRTVTAACYVMSFWHYPYSIRFTVSNHLHSLIFDRRDDNYSRDYSRIRILPRRCAPNSFQSDCVHDKPDM